MRPDLLKENSRKKVLFTTAVTCLLIIAISVGLLIPHLSKSYHSPVLIFADNIGKTLAYHWNKLFYGPVIEIPTKDDFYISSIFTPLQGIAVGIPPPKRRGHGGALTSWNDEVLLITHEGQIYVVTQELEVSASAIQSPHNGFEEYVLASKQPPINKLEHQFYRFRFNDISAFETADTRGLLVSYTRYDPARRCYNTTVSRLDIDDTQGNISQITASAKDWIQLYETKPCLPLKSKWRAIEGHRAGGRLVFDGNHTVYLASGDYGWDGMFGPSNIPGSDGYSDTAIAQDPSADYGKIIAINVNDGRARHVSSGHRNPQGITLDREGQVWVVEHGARGGDELNQVLEGNNYGWPLESLGTSYSVLPLPTSYSFGHHDTYTRPIYAWLPSIAVSGLTRVEKFHSAWDGDLLASSLRGQQLARIRVADNRVIFSEEIDTGYNIRYVHQHSDGRIVLWTDQNLLIYYSPAAGGLAMKYVDYRLNMTIKDDVLRSATHKAIQNCRECHSLNRGEHGIAPSLARIFGARIGKTSYDRYSRQMLAEQRTWSRELLIAYLRDPAAVIPGTLMPDPGIENDATLRELASILEGLATDVKIPFKYRD